jgi:mRNA interferase RelE/StbE
MASYRIIIRTSAGRQLRKLEAVVLKRIAAHIDGLQENPFPHGVEHITGSGNPPLYRLRVGKYRILYMVDTSAFIVTVCGIGHRSTIYRQV